MRFSVVLAFILGLITPFFCGWTILPLPAFCKGVVEFRACWLFLYCQLSLVPFFVCVSGQKKLATTCCDGLSGRTVFGDERRITPNAGAWALSSIFDILRNLLGCLVATVSWQWWTGKDSCLDMGVFSMVQLFSD